MCKGLAAGPANACTIPRPIFVPHLLLNASRDRQSKIYLSWTQLRVDILCHGKTCYGDSSIPLHQACQGDFSWYRQRAVLQALQEIPRTPKPGYGGINVHVYFLAGTQPCEGDAKSTTEIGASVAQQGGDNFAHPLVGQPASVNRPMGLGPRCRIPLGFFRSAHIVVRLAIDLNGAVGLECFAPCEVAANGIAIEARAQWGSEDSVPEATSLQDW
jgi:hypothetical protein